MATRSLLATKINDVYGVIYCHYDGYPEHHSPILVDHYSDEKMVQKLILAGNIRSLESSFDELSFYGEPPVDTYNIREMEQMFLGSECVYLYLFSNGEWSYTKKQLPLKWVPCVKKE